MSNEALAVATIGCDFVHDGAICDEQQAGEPFTKFTCLRMTQEHRIPNVELLRPLIPDGSLDFASSFERKEPGTMWQEWPWQLIGTGRAGGHVATAQAGIDGMARSPHDLDGKSGCG